VDAGWCLVHATQVDDGELRGMAESGAVVGLCPVTEANLGDGIFPAHEFLAMGGRCGVGSDSNVYIDAAAEVSLLEYGQRLARCTRNVLADGPGRSTGVSLFQRLQAGGSIALGGSAEALVPGAAADMLSLAVDSPALVGRQGDALVDSWIFAGAGRAVDCVWVQGRKLVEGGRHFARDRICRVYRQAMEELCA
jgi:formimidoylglutamate deiminase